jgi:uncharacterized iron-regulated protein
MSFGPRGYLFWPLVLTTACAHLPRAAPPPSGTFVDSDGHRLADVDVRARLAGATFVLVGEAHDNACDHLAEAHVIQLRAADGPMVVGLEMVAFDHQAALDRFSTGALELKDLWEALDWKNTWRFPTELYAPVFSAARTAHAIVALNAPDSLVHEVRNKGFTAPQAAQAEQVTPQLLPPPPAAEKFLKEAFEEHGKTGKPAPDARAAWDRFLRVQSFWDSEMAWRAFRASEESKLPAVLLAGVGHVEHGWGIASRLRVFAPQARVVSILPWRGGESDREGADLYYFCPETEDSAGRAAR